MFGQRTVSEATFFVFQEWERILGFVHAFSGRDAEPVSQMAESRSPLTNHKQPLLKALNLQAEQLLGLRQAHSDRVLIVDQIQAPRHPFPVCGPADGVILTHPGRFGIVRTADCVPIVAVAPEQRAVCLLHAGWRGTLKKICKKGLQKFQDVTGCSGQDLEVALGPCIRKCCYRVGPEVENHFRRAGHPVHRIFREDRLDLVTANRVQLEEMNVRKVLDSNHCTACRIDLFYSYRREKTNQRMWALAGFRDEVGC